MTERIDSHHHIWDLSVRPQPWISGDSMSPIARTFSIDELTREAVASGVTATLLVQSVASIEESEELLDIAATTPLVRGVIGYVDLVAADVDDQLDRLRERQSDRDLVGIRALVQDEPDPAWLARPDVIRGLRATAKRGLTFDLLIGLRQLRAAISTARALDECRFVLDHLAKPAIATRTWEPWASDVAELAACPNVDAKISGLVTEAEWPSWHPDDLQPYVDWALQLFGPDRLMFGSDWPVCTLAASYSRVVETAEMLLSNQTPPERDAIFNGTATRAYRLNDDEAT